MIYVLPYPHKASENFITKIDVDAYFLYLIKEPGKIYKKNITLDYNELLTDETIIIVGAEVLKHLFRESGITKLAGTIQKFYSKELDQEIEVGLIPDLKILETYPLRDVEFRDYLMNIFNYKEASYSVEFHYPEHDEMDFNEVCEYLKDAPELAVDLETSSLFPHKGKILGIVLAPSEIVSFYIPWSKVDKKQLSSLLHGKILIGHNFKFDIKWLYHNGVDLLNEKIEDTMLLSFLSNENKTNSLKDLAIKYTPFGAYDRALEVEKKKLCKIHKIKKADFTYDLIPPSILGSYACYDGVATFSIYNRYKKDKHSFIYDALLDASKEFALLELNGCYIDTKVLNSIIDEKNAEIAKYTTLMNQEIANVLGISEDEVSINLNSPKQLSNLLFNVFKYTPVKKTDAGQNSTDKEVLTTLTNEQSHISPFASYLMKYRVLNKYLTTYLLSIQKNLDSDGYIRSSFNLIGTVSGRLSSGKDKEVEYISSRDGTINFQNIPSKDKIIKKLFIAEEEDWEIFNLDLKNAELWVVGLIAKEPAIMEAFKNGEDIHSSTAKDIFADELKGVDVSEIKEKYPTLRQKAKTVNFAILYLAGPNKIAEGLGISLTEAKSLIKAWFAARPNVRQWLNYEKAQAEATGRVQTYFGRERYAQEVFSSNPYLASHYIKSLVNTEIQSVATDINTIGYCRAMKRIREKGLRVKPFGLVHDSIAGAVHKDDREEVLNIFEEEIQNVIDNDPKIGVDKEWGRSWGEVHD